MSIAAHNPPHIDWITSDDEDEYYSLIMTDPDAPSREDPKFGEYVHWVVCNIPNSEVEKGSIKYSYVGAG